jgi:hypothetical protein
MIAVILTVCIGGDLYLYDGRHLENAKDVAFHLLVGR